MPLDQARDSVPIRGLFNLTQNQSTEETLQDIRYCIPSPSGDYLI